MLSLKKNIDWENKFEKSWSPYQKMKCNSIEKIRSGNINYIITYEYCEKEKDYYLISVNTSGIVVSDTINKFIEICKSYENQNKILNPHVSNQYYWIIASTTELSPTAKHIVDTNHKLSFIHHVKNEYLISDVKHHIINKLQLMDFESDVE